MYIKIDCCQSEALEGGGGWNPFLLYLLFNFINKWFPWADSATDFDLTLGYQNATMPSIYSINFCFSSSSSSSSCCSNFLWGRGSHMAPGIYGGSLTALRCSKCLSLALLRFSAFSRDLCSFLFLVISLTHWRSPSIWPLAWVMNCGFLLRVHSYRDELACPWYFTPRLPKKKENARNQKPQNCRNKL